MKRYYSFRKIMTSKEHKEITKEENGDFRYKI